ncbi:MAG: cation:proton antiporter [Erythrobacter sp.]
MTYDLILLVLGLGFLAGALLPAILRRPAFPVPLLYLGAGLAIGVLWPARVGIDAIEQSDYIERFAEMAVIISLMSAGLKLDRPLGWHTWRSTWQLLIITMPLCIGAVALGGVWLLGLPLAGAVLLGAVIAPTDPVLASSVQVGPPGEEREPEVRFALTSEAGLNDGLAFPFVNLAVVIAATGLAREGLTDWLAVDVVWKIVAGTLIGLALGKAVAAVVFRYCKPDAVTDGYVALALTLVTYGATELAHGYGFIAVFVAALVFRRSETSHEYHHALHDFSEQTEQLLMGAIMLAFGIAIAQGLLATLEWPAIALAAGFLLVIRPVAGWLGLIGTAAGTGERIAIAGLGIRGIGTFYYLAHGLNVGDFPEDVAREIWAIAGVIVVMSVILHGLAAPKVMRRIERA